MRLKEKHLKEMGDCLEDIGLSVYDSLDLMNEVVSKLLDFKKNMVGLESSASKRELQDLVKKAKGIQKFIKCDCNNFTTIVTYVDFIVDQTEIMVKQLDHK